MYLKHLFLFFTYILSFANLGNSQESYQKRIQLRQDIFSGYDHDSLPTNIGDTLNVSLGVALRAFKSIDQLDGTISANIWLRYLWNDHRLAWNKDDYNMSFISLNTHPEADNKIWVPDIYLYNTAENPLTELDFSRAIVDYQGNVIWSRPGIITSTCSFDLTLFPFDEQHCYLKFGSWSYDGNQLNLLIYNDGVDISNYIKHEEWELISYNATKNIEYYNCCPEPYHDIKFFYNIRRNSGYYDLNIIIPTFATSTLILMTLFVPWSSGERISFAVTVMLSIVVFLLILSDNLPRSDQKPLLSQMIIGLTLFSLCGVFFTILISALSDYKENYSKDNGKLSNKVLEWLYKTLNKFARCDKNKETNKREIIIKYPQSFQYDESNVYRTESYNSSITGIPNSVNTNTNIQQNQNINHETINENTQTIIHKCCCKEEEKKEDKEFKENCEEMINHFENIYIFVFTLSFIIYCIVMFSSKPDYSYN